MSARIVKLSFKGLPKRGNRRRDRARPHVETTEMRDRLLLRARGSFSRAAHEDALEEAATESSVRLMRGNVSCQDGDILTEEKLEQEVKEMEERAKESDRRR
jgi:hypothetical protein